MRFKILPGFIGFYDIGALFCVTRFGLGGRVYASLMIDSTLRDKSLVQASAFVNTFCLRGPE